MTYLLGVMTGFAFALMVARFMALRVASEIMWRRPWVRSDLTAARYDAMTQTALAIRGVASCELKLPLRHWRAS